MLMFYTHIENFKKLYKKNLGRVLLIYQFLQKI